MTTKRLIILNLILIGGLGLVFLLPRAPAIQPSSVSMELPDFIGPWFGTNQEVSEAERNALAADTEFARKVYTNGAGDQIYVSVVMSGEDMNNSIHRPERCLPAQGWSIVTSDSDRLEVEDDALPVMRLYNSRPIRAENGDSHNLYSIHYYWFVGHNNITQSHTERTLIDMRDRLLYGYNQRWAYVTVVATITEGISRFGRSEEETDRMIRDFISELLPQIQEPVT